MSTLTVDKHKSKLVKHKLINYNLHTKIVMKSLNMLYKNVNVLLDFEEQPILTINSFPPFKHTVTEKYSSIVPEWFSSQAMLLGCLVTLG